MHLPRHHALTLAPERGPDVCLWPEALLVVSQASFENSEVSIRFVSGKKAMLQGCFKIQRNALGLLAREDEWLDWRGNSWSERNETMVRRNGKSKRT